MIKKLINFFKDEEGATMVEYGLMVALIAVVCIAAVTDYSATKSQRYVRRSCWLHVKLMAGTDNCLKKSGSAM